MLWSFLFLSKFIIQILNKFGESQWLRWFLLDRLNLLLSLVLDTYVTAARARFTLRTFFTLLDLFLLHPLNLICFIFLPCQFSHPSCFRPFVDSLVQHLHFLFSWGLLRLAFLEERTLSLRSLPHLSVWWIRFFLYLSEQVFAWWVAAWGWR